MSQILVLTKNIYNERLFEKKIRQLGHEAFVSANLIEEILLEKVNSGFIKMFHLVILSETIENREVKQLSEEFMNYSIDIFRKSNEKMDEKKIESLENLGIKDWIESEPKIEVLREKLSFEKTIKNGRIMFPTKELENLPISRFKLSSTELRLFTILYNQEDKILSREELCLYMWNRKKSNSTMSQLSVIVKSLKNKLSKQNVKGPIIETRWGLGYQLDKSIYSQIYID